MLLIFYLFLVCLQNKLGVFFGHVFSNLTAVKIKCNRFNMSYNWLENSFSSKTKVL